MGRVLPPCGTRLLIRGRTNTVIVGEEGRREGGDTSVFSQNIKALGFQKYNQLAIRGVGGYSSRISIKLSLNIISPIVEPGIVSCCSEVKY